MFVKLIAASAFAANIASAVNLREETQIPAEIETDPIVAAFDNFFHQQITDASELAEEAQLRAGEAFGILYSELANVPEEYQEFAGALLDAADAVYEALEVEGDWEVKALEASEVLRAQIVDLLVDDEDLQAELLGFLEEFNLEIEGAQAAYPFLVSEEVANFVKAIVGDAAEDLLADVTAAEEAA